MKNLFTKKVIDNSIRTIPVSGDFPVKGSLYVWSEPTSISVGIIKSAIPEKIVVERFKEKSGEKNYVTELTLINNKILTTTIVDGLIIHTNECIIDYVKSYLKFYNTPQEKRKLLQEMVDYKTTKVIPEMESNLQFQKEELNYFISLRDGLTI